MCMHKLNVLFLKNKKTVFFFFFDCWTKLITDRLHIDGLNIQDNNE